jgi:hypothetical protein
LNYETHSPALGMQAEQAVARSYRSGATAVARTEGKRAGIGICTVGTECGGRAW